MKSTTPDEESLADLLENLEQRDRVTVNDDESWSMELTKPLELKTGPVSTLRFKPEVTVADLEESDKGKGTISQGARLISALTGISYSNIRTLRAADFTLASLVAAKISGKGDETGGTS